MACETFFVKTPDEINIHVTRHLHTPLNCILFHGFGEGSFVWENFRRAISSISSTIAIDLRGHGNSDWDTTCAYRTDVYTSDALFALSQIKAPNKILVGHSLGGNVCIQLAKRMRHSLRALILVDCSPEIDPESEVRILKDFHEDHRTYSSIEEYSDILRLKRPLLRRNISLGIAHGALKKNESGLYSLKRDQELGNPEHWGTDNYRIWEDLDKISCPVLLLRGSASAILSHDTGLNLAKQFRNCAYKTITMSGHSIMVDNPEEFNAEVISFIVNNII